MKKKILLVAYVLGLLCSYGQKNTLYAVVKHDEKKDSIINYVNGKGEIVPKERAPYFEVISKQSDSLWMVQKYLNGMNKLVNECYYNTSEKKVKIGRELIFNKHGKVIGKRFYGTSGEKVGKNIKWFDNGNVNLEGSYTNGKQEGDWNFYHYNGKLCLKKVYSKGKLLSKIYFDEKGNPLPSSAIIINKEDHVFKGGKKKYYEKLKKLRKELALKKMKGSIIVRYVIDVKGRITDVTIDQVLPNEMHDKIVRYFENIRGWRPRIHYNRKIPSVYTHRLNFKS